MIRIGINGYGRIGRNVVRAIYETGQSDNIEVVAINDLASLEVCAHLTKYDTTHGTFAEEVGITNNALNIAGKEIHFSQHTDPRDIPWAELGVDVVMECAGKFKTRDSLVAHLDAGASKVLASYPVGDADYTIVYGVNHEGLSKDHQVVSNASCTTNCLAPVAKVLHEAVGIDSGLMTTIHSYTNDQNLIDKAHGDLYRARAAAQCMIPTKTGAAAAVGKVLPELAGRLDGLAVRVPTINVSLVDLVFNAARPTTVEEINALMKTGAQTLPGGILAYNDLALVSVDFNHHPASSIFDAKQTRVHGQQVKVMSWYDNEWGFSLRMLDVARLMTME